MQISMELLSRMTPRTDSGAGANMEKKDQAPTVSTAKPSFKKVLEDTRPVKEYPKLTERGGHRIKGTGDRMASETPQKPDDKEDMDVAAAGAAGNQAMVVFILEGNMEPTSTPAAETGFVPEVADFGAGIRPEAGVGPDPELGGDAAEFAQLTDDATQGVGASVAKDATQQAEKPDMPGSEVNAGNTAKAANPEPIGANETAGVTGEVMARTPTIKTSQQQGESNSETPGYGDSSPLENDNDATPVKGQKTKTYADAVRDALNEKGSVSSDVGNATPPLAEGLKPEQFRADQQMRQVAPETRVRAENLFDEMVSRIETMQTDTKSAMTIQLKPEFLGKVALEIAVDAAGLHVKINAEDSSVRSMINGQMATLIESLENKGISVVEVEVAYTGVDNGAFKDSQEGRAQPEHSGKSHRDRETDAVDGAAYYAALSFDALGYLLDEDVSSVEYRA